MNGNFYQNPTFPNNATPINMEIPNDINNITNMNGQINQANLENVLRFNKGKRINTYISFSNSSDWQNKSISGILEDSGNDFIIISDPSTNNWYLIKINNIDYIEFIEKINSN